MTLFLGKKYWKIYYLHLADQLELGRRVLTMVVAHIVDIIKWNQRIDNLVNRLVETVSLSIVAAILNSICILCQFASGDRSCNVALYFNTIRSYPIRLNSICAALLDH